jgi:uncharacterized membrane protein
VAAWGVAWYVVMFAVSIASTSDRYASSDGISKLLLFLAVSGFLFTVYLTSLELFVIHAICQWCVISAIIVTIIFGIVIADYRETTASS